MRTQNLLIVALASSCCVASAQVVVTQAAPSGGGSVSHSAPSTVSRSSSAGGSNSYHGAATQAGGAFGSTSYHGNQNGYSNAPSSHYGVPGSAGGYSHSLQGASLQPGSLSGHSENWHDSFGSHEPFGHEGEHDGFGSREREHDGFANREDHFDHGVGWHGNEDRRDWKAPEWNRREEERSHEVNRWDKDEHESSFHHEGWWPGHDFEGRFADRGKEYFGDLARMAERWTETNGGKHDTAYERHDGYRMDIGRWGSRETGFRNYWDYVPTFAWLRERASFFQERFWDWNWWR